MALVFRCSDCGQVIAVRYLKISDQVKCPACGHYDVVPPDARLGDVAEGAAHGIASLGVAVPTSLEGGEKVAGIAPYLASPWKRYWGHMIDQSLVLIPVGAIALLSSRSAPCPSDFPTPYQWFLRWSETPWAAWTALVGIAVGAAQIVLLLKRGQTAGKTALRTRIVTMDNRQPSWWRLVLVRPLIVVAAGIRPNIQWTDAEWGSILRGVLAMLALINALFVFGSDRRALHDHLAGTQVVDLTRLGKG